MAAWTSEEDDKLRRLASQGLSGRQIAEQMPGRVRNAVIGRLFRLGHKGTPRPKRKPSSLPIRPSQNNTQYIKRLRKVEAEMKAAAPIQDSKQSDDAPAPLMIPLLDLTDQMCRWVVTDDRPFLYCGHAAKRSTAYCEYHYSRMFAGRPSVSRGKLPMREAA